MALQKVLQVKLQLKFAFLIILLEINPSSASYKKHILQSQNI